MAKFSHHRLNICEFNVKSAVSKNNKTITREQRKTTTLTTLFLSEILQSFSFFSHSHHYHRPITIIIPSGAIRKRPANSSEQNWVACAKQHAQLRYVDFRKRARIHAPI